MKTRDLRTKLMNVLDDIHEGKISPADGRNVVGAANQINISLSNELKSMRMEFDLGKKVTALGSMPIT